jgi:hypothetical protein
MNTILRTLAVLALATALAGCSSSADGPKDDPLANTPEDISAQSVPATMAPTPDIGAGPAAVDLRSSSGYVILAKSGVSATGTTSIVGHVGVSPAGGTSVTGFSLVMDATNEFATSALVSGRIYAADFAAPSPTTMTGAVSDLQTAYDDAAGRSGPTETELGAGAIGAMTLRPGLYKWSSGVTVATDVVLSGGPNDVWIFQVGETFLVGPGAKVVLSGGAQARNVFYQVAGQTTLGVGSEVHGNILCDSAIVLNTGATLTGRALSTTAVTLDANEVVMAA